MKQKSQVSTTQQAAITAIQNFFLHDGDWQKVEETLAAAKAETYTENPELPKNSMAWRLDTIVRDSYWDLRRIGLTDEAAYNAVWEC